MIKTSIFGGGCFWCTEAIFNKINGVKSVLPGYIGGHIVNPPYEQVCTGTTGHSEVIKIEYDSSVILFN
ncbi:MAG: peptide-methionine (S)-S-oxide reductase, partial [Flavobacteriaceae bacterium]|nr:peptide-methionine (S)-S-oxide reductase [Flavobacteriaceae bacterium]